MLPLNSSFTYECTTMFKVSIEDGETFVPHVHIFSKERTATYKSYSMNRKVSAQMGVLWTCVDISTPADSSLYFFAGMADSSSGIFNWSWMPAVH